VRDYVGPLLVVLLIAIACGVLVVLAQRWIPRAAAVRSGAARTAGHL